MTTAATALLILGHGVAGTSDAGARPQAGSSDDARHVVKLRVTVFDSGNHLVAGLRADAFHVVVDGKERRILQFIDEPEPMSVALLVDKSKSMEQMDSATTNAVMAFVRALPSTTELSLVRFDQEVTLSMERIRNPEQLEDVLKSSATQRHTALIDAMYFGLSQLHDAKNPKRVLAIFSDGGENSSRYHEGELQDFVRESDAQIYLLGDTTASGYHPMVGELPPAPLMEKFCVMSGGQVIQTDKAMSLFPVLGQQLALLLQKQYVLAFEDGPSNHNDRKWRKLEVRVDHPHGTLGRYAVTRTGFLSAN